MSRAKTWVDLRSSSPVATSELGPFSALTATSINAQEAHGLTILLVEQNLDLVYMTADRCVVMDKVTIIDALSPETLSDPETARRYLAI